MSKSTYSDLQVVDRDGIPSGLEYYQPAQSKNPLLNISTESDTYKEASHLHPDHSTLQAQAEATPRGRFCGLTQLKFWILAAVIGIIVVGAVVGGIIGSSSDKKSNSSNAAPSFDTASSSSTNQRTSAFSATGTGTTPSTITFAPSLTVAITTTSVIGPSTTLLSDCPSSNNTLYQIDTSYFRKFCSNDLESNGENAVNTPTESLDDCIALCNAYNIQNQSEIAAGLSVLCNAVCWRATIAGDDLPGQCFGFTSQNSSGSFVFKGDKNCDSAAWINQSF